MQNIFTLKHRNPGQSRKIFHDFFLNIIGDTVSQIANELVLDLVSYGHVRLPDTFDNRIESGPLAEIDIVLNGTGKILHGKTNVVLKPGCVYLLPPGENRRAHRNSGLQKCYFQFRTLHRGIEILSREKVLSKPIPPAQNDLSKIAAACSGKNVLEVRAALAQAFSWFHEDIREILNRKQSVHARYSDFFEYVQTHDSETFALEGLASGRGVTKKQFAAAFQKDFGITPKQYFLQEQLLKIKELLLHSDLQIGEVGARFGFSDPYYFSRFFKTRTGVSPKEYRASARTRL